MNNNYFVIFQDTQVGAMLFGGYLLHKTAPKKHPAPNWVSWFLLLTLFTVAHFKPDRLPRLLRTEDFLEELAPWPSQNGPRRLAGGFGDKYPVFLVSENHENPENPERCPVSWRVIWCIFSIKMSLSIAET